MSMGAKSYRWFHDGCCECVGDRCMNYGINESRYFYHELNIMKFQQLKWELNNLIY